MARKIFTVIAVLMFILTLSSCQKGVSQEEYDGLKAQLDTTNSEYDGLKAQLDTTNSEYDGLKAQLDTTNSELSSYKESAEQAEADLSDLKSNVAIAKQYVDILSALFNISDPNSPGTDVEKMIAITTMVNDTGNQELIDEWNKIFDTTQGDQVMTNVFSMVLKGITENITDL